jgi:hypothetical protein
MLRTPPTFALPLRVLLRRGCLGLACLATLTLGCHSLDFFRNRPKVDEKIDRPAKPSNEVGVNLPSKYAMRVAPYVFLSDFEIPREQPLFNELAALRDQVYKELYLDPGTAVVQVYLFETRERYERYLQDKHPDLPARRAFFIAQPRAGGTEDLIIYTFWGDRIRQDLRHELTHALLHSVIRDVPQWLDEGLAEYFELPPEKKKVNADHVELLRKNLQSGSYKLDLARLERLEQVNDMTPAEYREAWAWVHLMLHSDPEARDVLLSYLQQLRTPRQAGKLAPKLAKVFPELEKSLADHLAKLDADFVRSRVRPLTVKTAPYPLRPEVSTR